MATSSLAGRKPIASLARSHADPSMHVDWVLLGALVGLCAAGLLAIYSARFTSISLAGADTLYFVKRQGTALAIGFAGMGLAMLVDYRKLAAWAPVIYAGTVALVGSVLVLGQEVNGARAWFAIGPFQLQPAELAKVTLIVVLAAYLSNERFPGVVPFPRFVGSLALLGLVGALVLVQPDLGSASVLVVITMGILLVAGAKWQHILLITMLALVSAVVIYSTDSLDREQYERITAFLDQRPTDENKDIVFQVRNSKAAISQGGLTGAGYLQGPMTNGGYVPENHTDFVFSAVAEQFGLLGSGVLLLLYAVLAVRIWRTAQLAKDQAGALICAGALALLVWHVFENVGMNLGLMPVTGIPLPLVSYGGSATIAFLTLMGLVESVHMRRYA